MNLDDTLKQYDYQLPDGLIAKRPAAPRDSARLLAYDRATGRVAHDRFKRLGIYLPKNALLVFNQTRVIPARLPVLKPTGGRAELLYLSHNRRHIQALSNKQLSPGTEVSIASGRGKTVPGFRVVKKTGGHYRLLPLFPLRKLPDILNRYGSTPLPPYMKDSPLSEKQRRQNYQTIFAKKGESVAAPTASLHFTRRLLRRLRAQGIDAAYVRLDVGLGTFAPLKNENLASGTLHGESYSIEAAVAKKINLAKKQGRPVIAVGTTVVRTLESAAKGKTLTRLSGSTDLFIRPGYKFKIIDGLITNFHVPKSSLLMLVSALTGRNELFSLYNLAISKRYRFFSFGDGMLIT